MVAAPREEEESTSICSAFAVWLRACTLGRVSRAGSAVESDETDKEREMRDPNERVTPSTSRLLWRESGGAGLVSPRDALRGFVRALVVCALWGCSVEGDEASKGAPPVLVVLEPPPENATVVDDDDEEDG